MADKDLVGTRADFGDITDARQKNLDAATASAADKEGLLDQFTSTSGLIQLLLAGGALAAGEEEVAGFLGLQAFGDASSRAKKINAQKQGQVAAAEDNLLEAQQAEFEQGYKERRDAVKDAADTAKVAVDAEGVSYSRGRDEISDTLAEEAITRKTEREAVQDVQTAYQQNPKGFIHNLILGGAGNAEINKMFNMPDDAPINWVAGDLERTRKETADPILERMYSKLDSEPSPEARSKIWENILRLSGHNGVNIKETADGLATGGSSFDDLVPSAETNFDANSVINARKSWEANQDPVLAMTQLEPKSPSLSSSDVLSEEERARKEEGQRALYTAMINNPGMLPNEAVQFIEDPDVLLYAQENYLDWGFPGTMDDLSMFNDSLQFYQADSDKHNAKWAGVAGAERFLYGPDRPLNNALDNLSKSQEHAKGAVDSMKMGQTDRVNATLRTHGVDTNTEEGLAAKDSLRQQAMMNLPNGTIKEINDETIRLAAEGATTK